MLPDRSILIGQKLAENAKIQKFKCVILGDFQTLCARGENPPGDWMRCSAAKKCSNMIIRGKEARNDIDEPFKSFPVHLTDY